jgi:hypothetical protein
MLSDKENPINKSVFFVDKIGTIHKAIVESVSTITKPEPYYRLRFISKTIPVLLGVPASDIFLSEDEAYSEMTRRIKVS